MTVATGSFPKWVLIVSGFFALLEIGISLGLCYSPEAILDNIDLNAKGVLYVVYMWAARQFALGIIFAFATYKRSAPMLTLTYTYFFVMLLGDLVIGIVQKENSMIIASLVMSGIVAGMLFVINKKKYNYG